MKKKSFEPIVGTQPTVMLLGSLPGEKSLEIQQYYGFKQNRFWKIMFKFFNQEFSEDYQIRINLIQTNPIILWDVAHSANRNGSLDSAILEEEPNAIEALLEKHPSIQLIIFNGKKAEQMFNRFFKSKKHINYIVLPSTSPANASYSFEKLFKLWDEVLSPYLKL